MLEHGRLVVHYEKYEMIIYQKNKATVFLFFFLCGESGLFFILAYMFPLYYNYTSNS